MKYQFRCPWCGKRYFDFDALEGIIEFKCTREDCPSKEVRRVRFSNIQGVQFVNGERPRKNSAAA